MLSVHISNSQISLHIGSKHSMHAHQKPNYVHYNSQNNAQHEKKKKKNNKMKETENLNRLGVVTHASIFGVGPRSARIPGGGPNNAGKAPEHRFGSPEASESEDGCLQPLLFVGRVAGGLMDPIREPDAESIVESEHN